MPRFAQPTDIIMAEELNPHSDPGESIPVVPPLGVHRFQYDWFLAVSQTHRYELMITDIEAQQRWSRLELTVTAHSPCCWRDGHKKAEAVVAPIGEDPLQEGLAHSRLASLSQVIHVLPQDVPARVVINEYINVAHAFFNEDEPKVVNGMLDKIAHVLRTKEFEA